MFKSNLPKGWDVNKHYSPILTDHDKKVRSEKIKQIAAERDTEYYEKLHAGIANRDNTYQAECNARPDVQEKISKSLKENYTKTDEHLAKVAAKNKERSKTIITPWGEFESRKAAVVWAQENTNIVNVDKKIQKWVKTPNSGFYYKDTE
jgi:vacuolar-type H+-ATPase subunit E/Vma4